MPLETEEADRLRLLRQEKAVRLGGISVTEAIRRDLFDRQLKVIDDPKKRKTARCGRRAGKTFMDAGYLLLEADANKEKVKDTEIILPYIALTKGHARRLLWPVLERLNKKHGLSMKFNQNELIAQMPSGAKIWLTGADKPAEIEKLRGGAYPLVIIDEGASFGPRLSYLIDEVLDAALEDFDGTILLSGSPGAACAGKFYEVDVGVEKGWSRHHWTVLDNPKFPRWVDKGRKWRVQAKKWLAQKKQDKNWQNDNPIYQREWKGKWVKDESSLVYRWDAALNAYEELPQGNWEFVIGVDLGFDDATAFAVLCFADDRPDAYLVEERKRTGMIASEVAMELRQLREMYAPIRIVADTGGLGKMIVQEIQRRWLVPVEAAQKTHKHDFIELLNDDLRCGRFFAPVDGYFAEEASYLQWDEDRKKEDDRFDNHMCDAVLYGWRELRHYRHIPAEIEPDPGTPEYYDKEVQKMYNRRLASMNQEESAWWQKSKPNQRGQWWK